MTITLTIEELRAFESQCKTWTHARADLIAKTIIKSADRLCDPFAPVTHSINLDAVAKWDAANPFPKLIPSV